MTNYANILRNLRLQANLSQAELAQKLGISRSAISSYENGTRRPNHNMLIKMASFFDVSVDYLLGKELQSVHHPVEQLLLEVKDLFDSSNLDDKRKIEIMAELKDYLQYKISKSTSTT